MATPLCLYKYERYLKYVNISWKGAIELGANFEVDGYAGKPFRVITHAHADHLNGLEESVRNSRHIIATPITLDLIEHLGYISREIAQAMRAKSIELDYYKHFRVNGETCTLLPADHVPGSAQVVIKVENENLTLCYTGDFKISEKTEIVRNPSVLVIESTYGHPLYTRPYKTSIPQILVDIVIEGLSRYKRVYIYAYHGKMQEVMEILRKHGVEVPFILPNKVYGVTSVLEKKYGYRIGNYHNEKQPPINARNAIVFKHFNAARNRRLDGTALHIVLTGRLVDEPFKKVDDYTYVVSLSDHADFTELLYYVEQSSPELVVIDKSRSDNAEALKEALSQKGFCTITMP